MAGKLFTSESVTEGHPDKVCDNVSDAILDAIISQDKYARVACETLVTTGLVVLAGEVRISTPKAEKALLGVDELARDVIREIGYDDQTAIEDKYYRAQLALAREHDMLALIVEGLTAKEMADRLGVSIHTIATHTRHLLRKLGVRSRAAAVARALRERMV